MHAYTSGFATCAVVAATVSGFSTGCSTTSPQAIELLREAAKVICDAQTVKAEGTLLCPAEPKPRTLVMRWIFGPQGEYRITGNGFDVVVNSRYIAERVATDGVATFGGYVIQPAHESELDPKLRSDRRLSTGLLGFHGLAAPLLGHMRAMGGVWVDEAFGDWAVETAGQRFVDGHWCHKIIAKTPGAEVSMWIDAKQGVLRKYSTTSAGLGP